MSAPIPFDGTPAERVANRDSHHWMYDPDDGEVCSRCCAKAWHAAAEYPCGVEPPRSDDPALVELSMGRFFAYGLAHCAANAAAADQDLADHQAEIYERDRKL